MGLVLADSLRFTVAGLLARCFLKNFVIQLGQLLLSCTALRLLYFHLFLLAMLLFSHLLYTDSVFCSTFTVQFDTDDSSLRSSSGCASEVAIQDPLGVGRSIYIIRDRTQTLYSFHAHSSFSSFLVAYSLSPSEIPSRHSCAFRYPPLPPEWQEERGLAKAAP